MLCADVPGLGGWRREERLSGDKPHVQAVQMHSRPGAPECIKVQGSGFRV